MSFEVKLHLARLPFLLNPAEKAAHCLSELQALCCSCQRGLNSAESTSSNPGKSLQELMQALRVLSHVSLAAGHGRVAEVEMMKVIDSASPDGGIRYRIYSLLGRHYISWGDVVGAEKAFQQALDTGLHEDTAEAQLNNGFLQMSRGDYAAARECFSEAAKSGLSAMAAAQDDASKDVAAENVLGAENNLAVCRLYTKQLVAAQDGLEAALQRDPLRFFKPCIVQNLVSLYEFFQDSARKQQVLKEVAVALELQDLPAKLFETPSG
eukprot:TRINITY_DN21485_c1_g2_i1.p1 TRINITY_DN21485_c1_g2~~TRINITY_DN21485_c1_g2_i1.p1  ORF type:complete len:308 (-),score=70.79 TRINITY_DN21485_c1_g2_i1:114-911(-)